MALSNIIMAFSAAATQSTALDLTTATAPVQYRKANTLTNGTGANQADLIFTDTRTLAASATEDLDLAGVLVGAFGATLTFARVKGLFIVAAVGNTNNVNVTRPAANGVPLFLAASDGVAVRPGGWIGLSAPDATGYPVTAATGDLVTITNSAAGTSVTYDVIIIGSSA